MRKSYTLAFAALLPLLGLAQKPLEAGLFLGASNYQGDFALKQSPRMSESNFAAGLMARTQLDPAWGLRANLLYGKLSGDDANYEVRAERGHRFETTLVELSVVGEWEPLKSPSEEEDEAGPRFSPYVFFGLGLAFIDVRTTYNSDASPKAILDQMADYSNVQFAIPMGLGAKFRLNDLWTLGLEVGTRATFTDYLDGVSQAGKPSTKDWYLFGGLWAMYRIQ